MSLKAFYVRIVLILGLFSICAAAASAQALSAGTVAGVVVDPNNAAVPNANVTIANVVTGYTRTVTSGSDGTFRFDNVPPNSYQLSVTASGFRVATQSVNVRTSVPISVKSPINVGDTTASVTVSVDA